MHIKELDSIGLIKLCTADMSNDTAWQELVGRFSEKIKTYLVHSCWHARGPGDGLSSQISAIPEQVVDDLAQQLWLRLIERDGWLLKHFSVQTEEAFCAYLATLAASLAHNHYRDLRRKKRPRIAGPQLCPRAPASRAVETSLCAKERIAQLHQIVRSLYSHPADADRADAIFTLHFCQGRTADEIAECPRVHCSRRSVSRIILRLKKFFKQYAKVPRAPIVPVPTSGRKMLTRCALTKKTLSARPV